MSFATDISTPNAKRIILGEIDIPLILTNWINYEAGIWFTTLLDANVPISDSSGVVGYYYANVYEIPEKIGSCLVDAEFFTKVTSIELCRSTEKSFYYDRTNVQIYIHFEDWAPYLGQIIRQGVVNGFCDVANSNGAYYDGIYYEPRIKSVSNLSQKKDPLFYGVQAFQTGSISFENDGFFDNYDDQNIYGQPIRLRIGIDGYEYDEFEQIYEGFVNDYPYDFSSFSLKIKDKRDNLSRKIPYDQFTQDEFPHLNDDDVGKYKPVVFGSVFYMPVVCINKDESSPTYRTFKFLDTEFSIADSINSSGKNTTTIAYIKNDEDNNIFDTVTIDSVNLVAGTFNIDSDLIKTDPDEEVKDVFFTGFGFSDTDESISMLESLIDQYSSIAYNSTFFNITEINSEITAPRDVGYYVKKPETIKSIIGKIMDAEDALFYDQNDGKFSIKQYDVDRASTKTLKSYNWKSEPSFASSIFLTSTTVSGKKHLARNDFLISNTNTDYETEGLQKYKKYESKGFETILTTDSDIDDKAENVMVQAKDKVKIVKRTCDMSAYDIDLMDFITASHTRQSEDEDFKVWEVIGKNINLMNGSIELEMKYNRDA